MIVIVKGRPVAQPRTRSDSRTRRHFTPDPKGFVGSWKTAVRFAWRRVSPAERARIAAWRDGKEPLHIAIQVRLEKPPTSKLEAPTSKPDWDNLAKAVQDAMENEGVLGNDSWVVSASVLKVWADHPSEAGATIALMPWRDDRPGREAC